MKFSLFQIDVDQRPTLDVTIHCGIKWHAGVDYKTLDSYSFVYEANKVYLSFEICP